MAHHNTYAETCSITLVEASRNLPNRLPAPPLSIPSIEPEEVWPELIPNPGAVLFSAREESSAAAGAAWVLAKTDAAGAWIVDGTGGGAWAGRAGVTGLWGGGPGRSGGMVGADRLALSGRSNLDPLTGWWYCWGWVCGVAIKMVSGERGRSKTIQLTKYAM